MPCFIRLTESPDEAQVLVNADQIQCMRRKGTLTKIFFHGSDFPSVYCTETYEQIEALIWDAK